MGTTTTNGYFYLPSYGASGTSERASMLAALEAADIVIAALYSASHAAVTLAGSPNYLTLSGQVLTRSLINLASHVTGTLPIANGGTGATTLNNLINLVAHVTGTLPVANGGTGATTLNSLINLAAHVTGTLPVGNGGTGATSLNNLINLAAHVTGTLPVANGGSGATTFTDGGVLIGNTTGAVQSTSAGTAGQVLTSNGAGVDPTFQGNMSSGTYTPTRSAESNLDANAIMTEAQYMRVGNTVTVSGRFAANPTSGSSATSFEITLPVSSNIGAAEDVAGVAFCGSIASMGAEITGSAANNTAKFDWVSTDTTLVTWSYIFTYQVI